MSTPWLAVDWAVLACKITGWLIDGRVGWPVYVPHQGWEWR